jgi:putative oxidoreductase
MEFGLLLLRVVVGLLMATHGAQKLFGWFGGAGVEGTGGFLASLSRRPRRV